MSLPRLGYRREEGLKVTEVLCENKDFDPFLSVTVNTHQTVVVTGDPSPGSRFCHPLKRGQV